MKRVSKRRTHSAPRPGTLAYEFQFYSRPSGLDKTRIRALDVAGDILDQLEIAFSEDNGRTFPESLPVQMGQQTSQGILRRSFVDLFVDPSNGRQIIIMLDGLFTSDNPIEGMSNYYLRYRTSEDGGRTAMVDEPIVQAGHNAAHPMPGQWVGSNGACNSGGSSIIRLPDGKLLYAAVRTVLGPDGKFWDPLHADGFFEIVVLFGRWSETRRGAIDWRAGPVIDISPDRSMRGIFEPTVALMDDGRILMVSRGSNESGDDRTHLLPSHKWMCVSSDGGATWTDPAPWTYEDGSPFFSSSSISSFLRHSNRKLFWIGHVSDENCRGNLPRDHLYIGRVDPCSLGLIRDSITLIDRRENGDRPVQISCAIFAHEDRETGEVVVNVPRFEQQTEEQWGGDCYEYRLSVE
jgi:hypothetical protein